MISDSLVTRNMEVFIPELADSEIDRTRKEIYAYHEGKINEDAFRKFRLENGIYGIRFQKDIHMIRVKIPGGMLNAEQLEMLGEIADVFAVGIGHVSTRQNVQLHWVSLEAVPELLRRLAEVGLNTREACGNTVRNVTACPLAGVSDEEVFDVTPYTTAVANYFIRNPVCQNLPRKFKIAFEGCTTDHAAIAIHDIGARAVIKDIDGKQVKGFRIYVAGGLSTMAIEALLLEDFTPVDQMLVTFEAILRIFDRMGNRENMARARMKFIVQKVGHEKFRELVLKERMSVWATRAGDKLWNIVDEEETSPHNEVKPNHDLLTTGDEKFEKWMETNVRPQKQRGYAYVYVTLPAGDITSEQFRELANITRRFTGGKLRTTRTQNLVLRWIQKGELYNLYTELKRIGIATPGIHRLANVIGCPGADTCNLAITHSHRLALELFREFNNRPDLIHAEDTKDIHINVSGCPNSCGQHHISPIGFYGSAQRVNEKQAPFYTMLLGGEVSDGKAIFGQPVTKVPAKRVGEVVVKLIDTYRAQRDNGESFMQWIRRLQKAESESGGKRINEPVVTSRRPS